MKERRYNDSEEIISTRKTLKEEIATNKRNIIRGVIYCSVCAIFYFILK